MKDCVRDGTQGCLSKRCSASKVGVGTSGTLSTGRKLMKNGLERSAASLWSQL